MKNDRQVAERLLRRLERIINGHIRIHELPVPIKDGLKLSAKEIHCLQAIGRSEGSNVKAVGDQLGVTKSAASQMIGKLVGKGYVVKQAAVDNDKETLVFLTPQGWEAFRAHQEFHEGHISTMVKRLEEYSPDQLAATDQVLEVLEGIMNERMSELFGK